MDGRQGKAGAGSLGDDGSGAASARPPGAESSSRSGGKPCVRFVAMEEEEPGRDGKRLHELPPSIPLDNDWSHGCQV